MQNKDNYEKERMNGLKGKRFYIFIGCILIIALLIGATFIGLPSGWAAYPSIALAGIAYYIIISSGGCHNQENEKGGGK